MISWIDLFARSPCVRPFFGSLLLMPLAVCLSGAVFTCAGGAAGPVHRGPS
jgi:hypothetical protein